VNRESDKDFFQDFFKKKVRDVSSVDQMIKSNTIVSTKKDDKTKIKSTLLVL
jgi:hypothetical protein